MNSVQIYILLIVSVMLIIMIAYFFRRNTNLHLIHAQQVNALEFELDKNQRQIMNRQHHLNKYHFLKNNLDEALVIQPEIQACVKM